MLYFLSSLNSNFKQNQILRTGTFCVIGTFPFIFSQCFGCETSHKWAQVFYYAAFVCIFQFGWASVQVSHLSLIPDLSSNDDERATLTSIRYNLIFFHLQ